MATKLRTKLTPITAHELFKMQVKGTYDNMRVTDKDYVPAQFGGPHGQREAIQEQVVLNITDFEG